MTSSRASEQEWRPFVDSEDYFTNDKKENPTPYRQEPIFEGRQSVAATYPPSSTNGQYIVMQQPHGPGDQPHTIFVQPIMENPPSDHMSYSIFAALCCCFVIGLMAICKSRECQKAILNGNRELAEQKSRSARNTANAAVGFGIVLLIIYVVSIIIRVTMSAN